LIGLTADRECLKSRAAPGYVWVCADLYGRLSGLALDTLETSELPEAQSRELAAKVREELARRRMSRQRLADEAKISISTLEKALSGARPFTLATIIRLEEALRIKLRPAAAPRKSTAAAMAESAPLELGGYNAAAVKWLEGDYLTLRPSFDVKEAIYAYRVNIAWSADDKRLCFKESERLDAPFSQEGAVSVPSKSGYLYLYTNDEGQFRVAILGRPLISGEMYGILTTLRVCQGGQLQPVAVPIVLLPLARQVPQFGRITRSDPVYRTFREHLDRAIREDYVRLILP
jgi:transcriptional regulator with XRE-family HTH domain